MLRPFGTARPGLQIRVAIYIVAIAVLFLLRGNVDVRRFFAGAGPAGADSTLRIAGTDLAPTLISRLADHYRVEYPRLDPRLEPGGTYLALEFLLQGRAEVGFLARPPTAPEQALFRETRGDTLLWYPAALAGIVLLRSANAPGETADVSDLRARLVGRGEPLRLYAPDPNSGLWDAFTTAIQVPPDSIRARVVFLKDVEEVVEAVRADRGALGVASTLALADSLLGNALPIRSPRTGLATRPVLDQIGSGEYPLFHYVYVAVPAQGSREGGKFVTYVISAHGQHLVERAGFLPARLVLREIYLNRPSANRPG